MKEIPGLHESFEEIAQIGSFEIDLMDCNWFASINFCNLFGLNNSNEFSFQTLKTIVHPDFYEEVIKRFDDCLKLEQCQTFECMCMDVDKTPKYMEFRLHSIRNDQGISVKLKGTVQDISERKEKQEWLNNLIKSNQVKDEVLAVVAHDLKSPINQICGLLNLLRIKKDDSIMEILDYIENACSVASKIINELIEITEMDESGYLMQKSLVDINDLIKATTTNHEYRAREKSIIIGYDFCDEASAMVHPFKISRVIDNLISNAIKFTPAKGHIEIITEKVEGKVFIKIKDSGIGIQPAKLPFIFDRFSSARQPGTMGENSTGLGLSIVKKIVTLHNGKISVKSRESKGTEFVVELPE